MAAARSTALTERSTVEFQPDGFVKSGLCGGLATRIKGEEIFLVISHLDAFNSAVEYDSHLD